MYQKYLDPIIEEFTTGEYYSEVYQAKQDFFEKAGIVYEDDAEFEQRMCIFMDWYLFERDLPGVDLPPIHYFYRRNKDRLTGEDLAHRPGDLVGREVVSGDQAADHIGPGRRGGHHPISRSRPRSSGAGAGGPAPSRPGGAGRSGGRPPPRPATRWPATRPAGGR